jgi:ATP-dependent Clp protease ATP-binding subunit ClpB
VLDDGRLTDGHGRTVDCRNTVIVMTSNLNSQVIQELAGEKNCASMKATVMGIVSSHFRPEFISRVDDVVVFHPLARDQLRAHTDIQVERLRARLAVQKLALVVSESALDQLAEAGFDAVYGARPLKRAVQPQLENPLAQALLAGQFAPGTTIMVDVRDKQLHLSAAQQAVAA